jgi:hypothetical protein
MLSLKALSISQENRVLMGQEEAEGVEAEPWRFLPTQSLWV